VQVPNLAFIRNIPLIGDRLYEAFNQIQIQSQATEAQTNTNPTAEPAAPPPINAVQVTTGPGGEFQIAISDSNQISRGINYFAEHADNPWFQNPHVIDMGQSRNHSTYLGAQSLYWRAYSSYSGSPPSAPAYHGSAAVPLPVTGGVPGTRAPSQGSGTGAPGQGLQGPGPVQSRTANSGFDWTAQGSTKSQS
jgi:hypothetical protein